MSNVLQPVGRSLIIFCLVFKTFGIWNSWSCFEKVTCFSLCLASAPLFHVSPKAAVALSGHSCTRLLARCSRNLWSFSVVVKSKLLISENWIMLRKGFYFYSPKSHPFINVKKHCGELVLQSCCRTICETFHISFSILFSVGLNWEDKFTCSVVPPLDWRLFASVETSEIK